MTKPGQKHPLPTLPGQIEEALHGELTRVGAGHGARLSCGQYANGPDVHGGRAEGATQKYPTLVQVSFDRLVVLREHVGVNAARVDTGVVDLLVVGIGSVH